MALSKIDAANFLTGTIPQGNVANASLGAVTALPAAISTGKVLQVVSGTLTSSYTTSSTSFVATGLDVAAKLYECIEKKNDVSPPRRLAVG